MSNSFYIIRTDLDPKVTGIRSGAPQGKIDMSVFQDKLWLNEFLYGTGCRLRAGEFPAQDFKLEGIWLDKKAKLTDIISVGALLDGFMVNQKVVDILQTCHLPPHKFYEVTFDQDGKIIEGYYWFYFNLFDGKKYVNFEESVFDTSQEEKVDQQVYTIKSYQEYIDLTIKHQRGVIPKKLVFDSSFDYNLDVFGMRFLSLQKYISNRLKEKFEKHKIKGYRLRAPVDPKVDVLLEWE